MKSIRKTHSKPSRSDALGLLGKHIKRRLRRLRQDERTAWQLWDESKKFGPGDSRALLAVLDVHKRRIALLGLDGTGGFECKAN
ncbi:MAG TPA: hypothetical protein P5186_27635 [Candidatus Paceibacterota bacterium]|nr:hypothetical protein [Verrucomicrobiota bacterium]HRY51826.1 hypothetical protein [Candidatus Paceibacterota bacterium]